MGNTASKKGSVTIKTPEKSVAMTIDESPTTDILLQANQMLDPKTPAIPQTPLTQTIASHLNRITKDDPSQNTSIKTPSYLLRKKILYDLGYTYSIKDTDPRSPSHSIPRTPLNLDASENSSVISESQTSSFQYNSTLEDSCRDFNAKLDDITMDEEKMDAEEIVSSVNDDEDSKKECIESRVELCDQKTPNCDDETSPDFESKINDNKKLIAVTDESETDSVPKASEENISPLEGMYSTPLTNKSSRTGRIPLSVINRRGMSAELTPLQPKNNQEPFSVEKYKKDLSFNKFDDGRGSARKSKIPVFKK